MAQTLIVVAVMVASMTLANMGHALPSAPKKIGDPCEPSADEYLCSFINANDGNNFCHYKTETCEKRYSGCALLAEQIGCLATQSILHLVDGLACGSDEACHEQFENVEKVAEEACDVSLSFICDLTNCPENRYKQLCIKHKNVKGK